MPAYLTEDLYSDVAQVQHEAPDGFGSGRLVGCNLILTARHVVTIEGVLILEGWQVRLFGARPKDGGNWQWHDAKVIWTGKGDLDLALLAVRPKGDIPMRPKLTLRVAKANFLKGYRVRGLGFPLGTRVYGRRELMAPVGDLIDEGQSSLTWGIDQSFIPKKRKKIGKAFQALLSCWRRATTIAFSGCMASHSMFHRVSINSLP